MEPATVGLRFASPGLVRERGICYLWSLPIADCKPRTGAQTGNLLPVELTFVGLRLLSPELAHRRASTCFCGALHCRIAVSKPRTARTGVRDGGNLFVWSLAA